MRAKSGDSATSQLTSTSVVAEVLTRVHRITRTDDYFMAGGERRVLSGVRHAAMLHQAHLNIMQTQGGGIANEWDAS